MARVVVSYNGTSLQTANIITQEIEHESVDGKQLDLQKLAARDGAKFLSANFNPRVIRLRGYIKDTTQANMEAAIDDFKELLNSTTKNLDIGYASGTRRYVCDMSRLTLIREHFNVTFAEWEAEFVCAKTPFGKTLDTTSSEHTITSLATYAGSFVALGNYKPKPRIIITFSEVAGVNHIRLRNTTTGDWIDVDNASGYANNDIVIIDCDQYTVTLNGVAWDYSGFFPQFQPTGNDLRISFTPGIHYKATIVIIYYPLFL
jgi:hypothetical protein